MLKTTKVERQVLGRQLYMQKKLVRHDYVTYAPMNVEQYGYTLEKVQDVPGG